MTRWLPADFVGRDQELLRVFSHLDRAEKGSEPVLILIAGEPGVGKTRLMLEAAAGARQRDYQVIVGRAYEAEGMPSYLPFIEALRDCVQTLPRQELVSLLERAGPEIRLLIPTPGPRPAPAVEGDRYRLFESVVTFLQGVCESRPLLLCLDDLHWADDASLLLLQHVVRRLAPSHGELYSPQRFLILGTYRTVDLNRQHPLADMLGALSRERLYERMLLDALNLGETAALIATVGACTPAGAVVDAIYGETNGNPFFVEEVVRHLLADNRDLAQPSTALADWGIPEGVRQVLGHRLSRLTRQAERLLQAAAVLGTDLDQPVLASAIHLDPSVMTDKLEEALAAGLLRDDGDTCRFSHPLVREAVYDELSLPRKQQLHLRVAQAIEEVHSPNLSPHMSALASHLRAAGVAADLEKTINYSEQAAATARSVFAWQEAIAHYEGALQALDLAGRRDDQIRCNLLLGLGETLVASGNGDRARDVVAEEAFALAEKLGDPGAAFRAVYTAHLSLDRSTAMDLAHAGVWAERADRTATAGTPDRVKADLMLATFSRQLRGDDDKYRSFSRSAFALAQKLADPHSIGLAAALLLQGIQTPEDHDERLRVAAAVTPEVLGGSGPRGGELLLGLSFVNLTWCDRPRAEAEWAEIRTLAKRSQNAQVALLPTLVDSLRQILDGHLEDAVVTANLIIDQGIEIGKEASARQLAAAVSRRALLYLGRTEEALERIAQPPGLWTTGGVHYAQRALFLAHIGRRQEARALLDEFKASRDFASPGDPTGVSTLRVLLEASVVAEDRELASALIGRMAPLAGLLHTETYMVYCLGRSLGGAALILGRPGEARHFYNQAVKACERVAFRPEMALTHLELGSLLLEHYPDERATAVRCLEVAFSEFADMNMQPALERARRLLGRRRSSATPKPAAYPDRLSAREIEVLRLVTAGKSNLQIADALGISLNTVIHHVSNIFNKSGSSNRTEAAAYAHRHGLV